MHDHKSDEVDVVVLPGDWVLHLTTATEHPHHQHSVRTVGNCNAHPRTIDRSGDGYSEVKGLVVRYCTY